ncbi:hypothetical protein C8R45DRAFT_1181140, partial [Mycena sanguinolenta]
EKNGNEKRKITHLHRSGDASAHTAALPTSAPPTRTAACSGSRTAPSLLATGFPLSLLLPLPRTPPSPSPLVQPRAGARVPSRSLRWTSHATPADSRRPQPIPPNDTLSSPSWVTTTASISFSPPWVIACRRCRSSSSTPPSSVGSTEAPHAPEIVHLLGEDVQGVMALAEWGGLVERAGRCVAVQRVGCDCSVAAAGLQSEG